MIRHHCLDRPLEASGIKHNPDEILRIAKKPDGTIVFFGEWQCQVGLATDSEAHEFANRGISVDRIQDAIMAAVINGRIVGIQGRSRTIYEIVLDAQIQYISVSVSNNGYIVGANPTPIRSIRRLTQERRDSDG
ncbi:MAG: hypothetical protein GDA43_10380 [Hormoscilla sp. SP5CHS1]|nr:hypothetical protein [Hormoscilla sp. SP12CHS1]MBC6453564.1 hypothetical protein [Hormoscilla sp. SP5CHS1]